MFLLYLISKSEVFQHREPFSAVQLNPLVLWPLLRMGILETKAGGGGGRGDCICGGKKGKYLFYLAFSAAQ